VCKYKVIDNDYLIKMRVKKYLSKTKSSINDISCLGLFNRLKLNFDFEFIKNIYIS
jgi:hypothetical protein